jgi:hypothetical protein
MPGARKAKLIFISLFSFLFCTCTSAHVSITWDVYVQADDAYLDARRRYRRNFFQSVLKAMTTLESNKARPGREQRQVLSLRPLSRILSRCVPRPDERLAASTAMHRLFGHFRNQFLHVQQCSLTSGNCLACTLIVPALTRHGFLRFEIASVS